MFSIDDFIDSASGLIDSLTGGIESVVKAASGFFSLDLDNFFSNDSDPSAFDFDKAMAEWDGSGFGSEEAASTIAKQTESEFSIGDSAKKGLDFAKQNPEITKLGAGLISGAVKGYQTDKALNQQDRQFRERLDAEKEMLRDRYKYDSESQMEARKQKQKEAYGIFMGAQ